MKSILTTLSLLATFILYSQNDYKVSIDSILTANVETDHPGIAVGVIKKGKVVYENYRGLSNLQHQIDFDEKTRSNIASTAKQFTALMILDLAQKSKLNLEDDIRKYLPELYPDVEEKIRIRHLLNHTSGIRDYVELMSLEGDVWWKRFGLDNDDVLEIISNQKDLGFLPGSRMNYSNTNYNLLAIIIGKVTEMSFNDYSKSFFQKLGMNETVFVERYMGVIPNRANPYSDWGRGEWWEVPTVTKTNGEGFLFTTLRDQLTYEIALQNADKEKNTLLLESQKPIPNSEITSYGFGLKLDDRLGRTAVHHDGVTYGFHSQTIRFPEEDITVFIMSNNGNIRSDLIADQIASLYLSKKENETTYDKELYADAGITDASMILGQYRSPSGFLTRIVMEQGKMYFRQKKYLKLELMANKDSSYSFTDYQDEKIKFYPGGLKLFSPDGALSTFTKVNEEAATFEDFEGLAGVYLNDELDLSFELTVNGDQELKFKFSNEDESLEVECYNRNELLASENYVLKVERDVFDRVNAIRMDYERALNIKFHKKTKLDFQPKIKTEDGSIQVTTIGGKNGDKAQILLTKNEPNGNEIWFKTFGGTSYDKASSIIETSDGYLIIGSTSSYGKGNYDMFVIKTDKEGNQLWQNTYGKFYNEYGYTAQEVADGFIIKGTIQLCDSKDVLHGECATNAWFVNIDGDGQELSATVLERIK